MKVDFNTVSVETILQANCYNYKSELCLKNSNNFSQNNLSFYHPKLPTIHTVSYIVSANNISFIRYFCDPFYQHFPAFLTRDNIIYFRWYKKIWNTAHEYRLIWRNCRLHTVSVDTKTREKKHYL